MFGNFCSICSKAFPERAKYLKHLLYHKERRFHCNLCPKSFTYESHLTLHVSAVHQKLRQFPCDYCDYSACAKKYLKTHIINAHTRDFPYKCDQCPAGFFDKHQLEHHVQVKHEGKHLICPHCKKMFKDRFYFNIHTKQHEESDEKTLIYCEFCPKSFTRMVNLRYHQKKYHFGGLKSYVCEECGRKLATQESLDHHKKTHSGVKSFVCEVCGRAFARKTALTAHRNVHLKERYVMCETCGKELSSLQKLKMHKCKSSE